MTKGGFTMVEIVFVLVIMGILASLLAPKISSAVEDSQIQKAKSELASIRSAIYRLKQERILQGVSEIYPKTLQGKSGIFSAITKVRFSSHWSIKNAKTYAYTLGKNSTPFVYSDTNGTFLCPLENELCKRLDN